MTFGAGNLEADRYNVMVTASYQKESPLAGADRSFSSHGFNSINDSTSGNTFPANIAAADGSFATVNPTASTGCRLPYSQLDPNYPQTLCRFDVAPLVTLIPESERASLFASGKLALTRDLTAFVEASYSRNAVRTVIQPVPISDQFALPPNHPLFNVAPYNGANTILLTTASAFYPTGFVQGITGGPTPDLLVRYRSQTGNRDLTDISEAPRAVAGIKGSALGWDVDAALLYTESKVREHDNNGWPVTSEILPLLNSGTVNFFGPNTPAIQSALLATNFNGDAYTIKTSITSLGGKASREVFSLPAGPVAVAVGAEARKEKYDFSPSAQIAAGDLEGYGGNLLPNHSARDVEAVYGEVNVPIVKGLEGDVAVRFDHYQRVGNSTTPKASLRWQPTQEILLRGSFGQGFRAPSLQDLYAPVTSGVTGNGSTDLLRCPFTHDGIKDCATQFGLSSGGNVALKPEKSNNLNLGAVLEPNKSLSVGIDYFRVLLKDAIVNGLGAQFILADPVKYGNLIHRGPVDPNFPNLPGPITSIDGTNINLGNIKVSGIDVDLKWRLPVTGWGRLMVTLDGTYFNRYDTSNPDGSYTGNVDQANNATGGVIPRLKTYSTVDWTMGPWNVNFAQNFQKSYHDQADNITTDNRRVGFLYHLRPAVDLFRVQVLAIHDRRAQPVRPRSALHEHRRTHHVPERLRHPVRRSARPLRLRPRHLRDAVRGGVSAHRASALPHRRPGPGLASSLHREMKRFGCKPYSVATIAAAANLMRQWRFDAVVLDGDGFLATLPMALPTLRAALPAPILLLHELRRRGAADRCARLRRHRDRAEADVGAADRRQAASPARHRRRPAPVAGRGAAARHPVHGPGPRQRPRRRRRPGAHVRRIRAAAAPRVAARPVRASGSHRTHLASAGASASCGATRRSADMHVCRIRRKLRDAGARQLHLETVYGRGYLLRLGSDEDECAVPPTTWNGRRER